MRRGVVGVIARGDKFLIIKRSRDVVAPGKLCFPGGGIESGESPEGALVREFREELNLSIRPLRMDWESTTPWNVHLQWWIAEFSPPDQEPIPNPKEVESVLFLTWKEMIEHPQMLESNLPYLRRKSNPEKPEE